MKIKKSRRNKLRKKTAQLEILNAKKKTIEILDREGKLPKIVRFELQKRKTA